MYNTVQIVLVVWLQNDFRVYIKLYTNCLIRNVLGGDCVQIVWLMVKYR